MDFDFKNFSTRSFERFSQTMAMHVLGKGILVFGDGPDGGREATYDGTLNYPTGAEKWTGYTVMQAKFLQVPGTPQEDADWLVGQLTTELKKFTSPNSSLRKPDYYILVTNARLSPMPPSERGKGGIAKIDDVFADFKEQIGFKSYSVWHLDQLSTMLMGAPEIRRSYAAWLSTSDVISELLDNLKSRAATVKDAMYKYLMRELRTHQPIRLQQAGHSGDAQTMIEDVFTDLPYRFSDSKVTPIDTDKLLLENLLERSKDCLDSASVLSQMEDRAGRPERILLLGGPGQGKSTLSQFLAQIFRANILRADRNDQLPIEVYKIVNSTLKKAAEVGLGVDVPRRFPLRIDLPNFADWLTKRENSGRVSLLHYIADQVTTIADTEVMIDDLRQWISSFPMVLILDGLDEVPQSANRNSVLNAINQFWDEAAKSDLLMIITTRPQGYSDELDPCYYTKLELIPLDPTQALNYARKLASARIPDVIQRARVITRLQEAAESNMTVRLMVSPLQVAILLALIDQRGDAPTDRWSLFDRYFSVVLQREQGKAGQGGLTMRHWARQISAIHYKAGFLLHVESETRGNSDASLSVHDLEKLIKGQLEDEDFEGNELERVTAELLAASTERLVLLVQHSENRFSFEVRSLQEFMAAAHLMTGSESMVQQRLRTIACRSHWLHVFQIAASKCFSVNDAEHYRDTIVMICREINESGEEIDRALRAGSELALELLNDGLAYDQPKYRRLLLKTAMEILSTGPDVLPENLADHCQHDDRQIQEYLHPFLSSNSPATALAAKALVLSCASKKQAWAEAIRENIFSHESEDLFSLIEYWIEDLHNPNCLKHIIAVIENESPIKIGEALREFIDRDYRNRIQQLLDRFPCLSIFLQDKTGRFHVDFVIHNIKTPLSAKGVSVNVGAEMASAYENLPLTPPWASLRALRKFHTAPCKETLAELILQISTNSWRKDFEAILNHLPWPLDTLLYKDQDLLKVHKEVLAGQYGDYDDWTAAESRWKESGVTYSDLSYLESENFYDEKVATVGFFRARRISLTRSETEKNWLDQLLKLSMQKRGNVREWTKSIIKFITANYEPNTALSLQEILFIIEKNPGKQDQDWIYPEFLLKIPREHLESTELIERLNEIGKLDRFYLTAIENIPTDVYNHILPRTKNHPGLITISAIFILSEKNENAINLIKQIDVNALEKNECATVSNYAKILALINSKVNDQFIESLIITEIRNENANTTSPLMKLLTEECMMHNKKLAIIEAIARVLNSNPTLIPPNLLTLCIKSFANSRLSDLQQPHAWKDLKLGDNLLELTTTRQTKA